MAQQKLLLGHVKGDRGEKGIDAKVASATATVSPGHLDQPTCSVEMGGEPGAQTATFTFAGLQGRDGTNGVDGKSAGFGTVTVTVDDGTGDPSCEASWDGADTSKNLTLVFRNLKGDRGEKGDGYTPSGTSGQILLGDGTAQDIAAFLTAHATELREAIGLATKEHTGLVPVLPENPEVE